MTTEWGWKWLLRFIGVTTILAFVAAVMSQSWVTFLIHKAEPGIPIGILVTHLVQMLMFPYALVGLQCFLFAADIRRYLPVTWVLGVGTVVATVIGIVALFAGATLGRRNGLFWIVFDDSADGLVRGVLLVLLVSRIPRHVGRCGGKQESPFMKAPDYDADVE